MKMSDEMVPRKKKRITMKLARPNALIEEWLTELYNEAKQKKSKLEHMLHESLISISKYPLPIKSVAECMILKGFNSKLCKHLEERMRIYKANLARQSSVQSISSSHSSGTASPRSDIVNAGSESNSSYPPHENNHYLPPAMEPSIIVKENLKTNSVSGGHNNASFHQYLNPETDSNTQNKTNANTSRDKHYMPAFRSGPYAILRILFEFNSSKQGMITKEEIIEHGQKYAEESFVRPKPDTFYTAWSSITRLVHKGYVEKIGNKEAKYTLTLDGTRLAEKMLNHYKNRKTDNDIIFEKDRVDSCIFTEEATLQVNNANQDSDHETHSIELPPSSFDIILLIDKNETGGVSKKNDPTVAQFNKYYDLQHEYRSLKVGDFTWIARHQVNKEQELVLPYIVERKRMDDLGASIKDGRFHEQKFRLRKCGVPNVIYLVENYGKNKHVGLPIQNLQQALSNTQVQDGFKVHMTDSLRNSARFLAMMSRRLAIRYKDKTLKGRNADADGEYLMTFEYFNKASVKTKVLSVKEIFIKLLLQLKGVSVEKALAITAKYSTPKALIIAYQKCDPNEGELLLANLKYGTIGRNVGPVVSKSVYQLFTYVGRE